MKRKTTLIYLLLLFIGIFGLPAVYQGFNLPGDSAIEKSFALPGSCDYASNTTCSNLKVLPGEKEVIPVTPAEDNDFPLTPISRFILLQ